MATKEEQLCEVLRYISGNGCYDINIMHLLLENVQEFRLLCQTKYTNKRNQLATYLLSYASSRITDCLYIVYDDPYTTLLDMCIESLKKKYDAKARAVQNFTIFFADAKARAENELLQIRLCDVQQNHDNWFRILALLCLLGDFSSKRHWKLFYTINRDDLTEKYLKVANTVTQLEELVWEVAKEYYEVQNGDIQSVITQSMSVISSFNHNEFIERCLQIRDAEHIVHYWKRLKYYTKASMEHKQRMMLHLHSLSHISNSRQTLKTFSTIIKGMRPNAKILRDVLDKEMEIFEMSKDYERCARFAIHIIPWFQHIKTDEFISYIKYAVAAALDRGFLCDITKLIIELFRNNICHLVFTEDYIFNTIVEKIIQLDYCVSIHEEDAFEVMLPYFNRSFQYRDRLLQQHHTAIQKLFNDNPCYVITHGYPYFLNAKSIHHIHSHSYTWCEHIEAFDIAIDFCLEKKVNPAWVGDLLRDMSYREDCDPEMLKRVLAKLQIVSQFD